MHPHVTKLITQTINNQGIANIVALELDEEGIGSITPDISSLLQTMPNLQILKLSDNDLENVDGLPNLKLTILDLSNNRINQTALFRIAQITSLQQLVLSANYIKTIEGIKPLFKLKHLQDLDLTDNPVIDVTGYRDLLFKEIPTLELLDHRDKNGNQLYQDSSDQPDDSNDDSIDDD